MHVQGVCFGVPHLQGGAAPESVNALNGKAGLRLLQFLAFNRFGVEEVDCSVSRAEHGAVRAFRGLVQFWMRQVERLINVCGVPEHGRRQLDSLVTVPQNTVCHRVMPPEVFISGCVHRGGPCNNLLQEVVELFIILPLGGMKSLVVDPEVFMVLSPRGYSEPSL